MLADGVVKFQNVVVVKLVKDLTALLAVGDEPPCSEGAELMGNGRFCHAELGGEIADTELLCGEKGHESEAGGIGKDGEKLRHALRLGNLKLVGTYSMPMLVVLRAYIIPRGCRGLCFSHRQRLPHFVRFFNGQTYERMLMYLHYERHHNEMCLPGLQM